MKSERLKKLETELNDLTDWLRLGLVPKKDLEKHEEEINAIRLKISDEKERLQFLKESGDIEEYVIPKKIPGRTPFSETPTIPDMDIQEEDMDMEVTMETETLTSETATQTGEKEEETSEIAEKPDYDDEDDPYSDKNRWRRGILDPDADNW